MRYLILLALMTSCISVPNSLLENRWSQTAAEYMAERRAWRERQGITEEPVVGIPVWISPIPSPGWD